MPCSSKSQWPNGKSISQHRKGYRFDFMRPPNPKLVTKSKMPSFEGKSLAAPKAGEPCAPPSTCVSKHH